MSYKHLDHIQSLYESVSEKENGEHELVDEIITVVSTSMFAEGYSTTAIKSYFDCADPVEIIEKYNTYSEDFSFIDEKTLNEDADHDLVLDEESIIELNLVIEGIGSLIKAGIKRVAAPTMRAIGRGGRTKIKSAISAVKNKVGGGVKAVSKKADDVGKSKNWTGGANPAGKPSVSGSKGGPLAVVNKAKDATKTAATNVKGKVDDVIKNVKTAAKTPVKSAKTALGKVGNFVKKNAPLAGALTVGGVIGSKLSGNSKKTKAKDADSNKPQAKTSPKKSSGLSIGDAIKASKTDAGKDLVKSVTTPSKPSTASGKELPKAKAVKKGSAKANMIARNKETFGGDKVDKLRSKNAAFQAAKKSGSNYSMDDFVKDFPNSNAAKDRKKSKRVTSVMDMESVQYDAFDIVSNYLIDSNQVDGMDEALYVMTEMDAQTIQGIVEDFKKKA